MNKRNKNLLKKQLLKYFFIGLTFFIGFGIWRLLWEIPDKSFHFWILLAIGVLVISAIFDLISIKDIIPIFTK